MMLYFNTEVVDILFKLLKKFSNSKLKIITPIGQTIDQKLFNKKPKIYQVGSRILISKQMNIFHTNRVIIL